MCPKDRAGGPTDREIQSLVLPSPAPLFSAPLDPPPSKPPGLPCSHSSQQGEEAAVRSLQQMNQGLSGEGQGPGLQC